MSDQRTQRKYYVTGEMNDDKNTDYNKSYLLVSYVISAPFRQLATFGISAISFSAFLITDLAQIRGSEES